MVKLQTKFYPHFCLITIFILVTAQCEVVREVDVGIISAFAPEIVAYLEYADEVFNSTVISAGREYTIAVIEGKRVALTLCGIGMVNAALTTQNMIDTFDGLNTIIFSGIAGGVNPAYRIGDVLIPKKWANVHHQRYVRPLENVDGEVTNMYAEFSPDRYYLVDGKPIGLTRTSEDNFCSYPNATTEDIQAAEEAGGEIVEGFSVPLKVEVVTKPSEFFQDPVPSQFWFEVSPRLVRIAEETTAEGLELTQGSLNHMPTVNVTFASVSSDTFVDNAIYRTNLFDKFEADSVDMESASFMHVCATNKKECMVIRSVSDLAGGNDQGNQLFEFLSLAAGNSAVVLDAIIANL
eukprot:TRINITY_DN2190_c0_g1_i2.p1 TRINITY_DN2190_c0_g1~~TRINITY_DN2190_c0_g1_i2.p1  ORF type:complete len:350 (+),score=48.01 TRINITY_DN2190_c0_g1_i2:135-1184(+)